jgi:predicted nucleic acid-binding Zn ribbon protein
MECIVCGDPLRWGRADRRYCSDRCRSRAPRARRELDDAADVLEQIAALIRYVSVSKLERTAELLRALAEEDSPSLPRSA